MASKIERVLVLDDNDAQNLFWEVLLPEFEFKVFKSRAGAEGLEIVENENIQLVIVAWELGSMSGALFVQKVRNTRKRKRLPCLIYSKRMSPEDVAISKEIGIENILSVPLNKDLARKNIKQIIEAQQSLGPIETKLRAMEDCLAERRPTEVLKIASPELERKGPHLPRYKTILADTFVMIGQFDKAEKIIKEAIELDPSYLPAKYVQARCYTMQAKHDEAIAILDSLTKSSPKNLQNLLNLGNAYVEADRVNEAKEVVSKFKDLDPGATEIKDTEGKIALKEGDLPLAAQLLAETDNGDEIARFYNSLGISYIAKGDFEKGIETYLNAVKILADKAKLHLLFFNLGMAYRKKSDFNNSFHYLCESYIAEPGFEKSYNAIARAVGEFKDQSMDLPLSKIGLVKATRKKYLEDHPEVAEKIREKLEKVKGKT